MRKARWIGLALLIVLVLVGCDRLRLWETSGVAIRGEVIDIERMERPDAEALAVVLVKGELEEDTQYDQAWVTITRDTRVLEQHGDERRRVTVDALQVGQRVEASFTGPVAESYPVQAKASEVTILAAEEA